MFAIAVWDDARGCGLLARDRTGKKPLYYLELPGALYFALRDQVPPGGAGTTSGG